MADESETMTAATLRFPFQASLDGYSMVESDGALYYGLDISLEPAELPAQVFSSSDPESITQAGLGLGSNVDCTDQDEQQQRDQQSSSKIVFHPPRWDSLVKNKESKQESEDVAPRPVSVSMHPHRINTSDQQRFATDHEMSAAQEAEEVNMICESPSASTLDETEAEEALTIRGPVPSSSVQQFIPSRYYATPLIEDDLTSTPVAVYGLEKPSGHVPKKRVPAVLKQRGNSAAAQARPSSRHQRQPSPMSSAVSAENHSEESARASMSSSRRISMFLGRTPTPTAVPSSSVSRPTIGSISSSGSSATIATMRSTVSAVSDVSNATSITTTPSPTLVDTNQKPADTTTPDENQPTSSFARPQPLRRTTAPMSSFTTEHTAMTGADTRRNSIFNFSMPKFSSPLMQHRAGIQSSDNLTTIRAVTDDQMAIPVASNHPYRDSSVEASSSSRQMPFSPDSFVSPHTDPTTHSSYNMTNSRNAYNNTASFSQLNRPHTSHNDQRPAAAFSNISNPQYQAYTKNEQPQPQMRKLKKSDHHQHRATKFFTRIFVTDPNQKA